MGAETNTSTMQSTKHKRTSPSYTRNIRGSSSFGNLTDEQSMDLLYRTIDHRNGNLVKRTKSFWKFGKSDDEILEGMALWQHRDLVQTDNEKTIEREREVATLKRFRNRSLENQTISTNSSETLVNGQNDAHNDFSSIDEAHTMNYTMNKSNVHDERSMQRNDDNIYGQTDLQKTRSQPQLVAVSRSKLVRQSYMEMEMENKHNGDRYENHQPQQQQQQEKRSSRSTKSNQKSQKNPNPKPGQVIKTIEYYDTSDMDTLQKKQPRSKHGYKNQDANEPPLIINQSQLRRSTGENQFFDDDSVTDVIMKTVKRQEILKQYYSSGTDTERNSASSSDPYDCIVVDDHLVRRENEKNKNKTNGNAKMEFKTFRGEDSRNANELDTSRPGTLLPRTKLTKNVTSSHRTNGCFSDTDAITKSKSIDRRRTARNNNVTNGVNGKNEKRSSKEQRNYQNIDPNENEQADKSYGPWYDLWGQDSTMRMS